MMAQKSRRATAPIKKSAPTPSRGVVEKEPTDLTLLAGISAGILLLRLLYLTFWTPYGLAPDEAQYWHWLTHNDWSFLTKPPLTTWMMGVSTFFVGDSLVGVKLFALISQLLVPALGYGIAREVAGRKAGWWAFALLATLPLVAAGGLIMSPDVLLLPLWMAALWVALRAFGEKTEKEALCRGRWVIMGVLVGLAGLAKYSAALFYPLLFAFLLWRKPHWLRSPYPWLSGIVALAFQLPVLIWNYQHGWVGVEHVLWQTDGGGDSRHGGIATLLEFLGGQALVIGPVVFLLLLAVWGRSLPLAGKRYESVRKEEKLLLVVMSLPIFIGFALMTTHSKVQANWPLLGTVPPLVLLAVWLAHNRSRWLVLLAVLGIGLNGALSLALYDTGILRAMGIPLKMKIDPTKDLRGWADMGMVFGSLLNQLDRPVVLTSRYQTAAALAYHTPGWREVIYLNAEGRRATEYDLWQWPDLSRRIVVYVNENGVLPDGIKDKFEQCQPWHKLAIEQAEDVQLRMATWLCWGAR